MRNQLSDNLTDLIASLQDNPNTAPAEAVALAQAELAHLAGDGDQVYASLKQVANDSQLAVSADNAAIIYRIANLLATYDHADPAIKLYRKLLALSSNAVPVLVNLSELYAAQAQGDSNSPAMQEALDLATKAYTIAPQSQIAQECYAIRLYETESYQDAQKLLQGFIQKDTESARIRTAWKDSMQHIIEVLAAKNEIYKRSNLSQLLLHEFPGNEVATRNLQSIEKELLRRSDTTATSDATSEASH